MDSRKSVTIKEYVSEIDFLEFTHTNVNIRKCKFYHFTVKLVIYRCSL